MQCVLCEEPLTFGYESLTNIRGCLSIVGALLCFAFPRCFEIHVESAHPSSETRQCKHLLSGLPGVRENWSRTDRPAIRGNFTDISMYTRVSLIKNTNGNVLVTKNAITER